jgi:hypothetical protein
MPRQITWMSPTCADGLAPDSCGRSRRRIDVTCNITVKTWSERISEGNCRESDYDGRRDGVGDLGAVAEELVIDDARTAVTDSGRFRGDIFEDLPTRISQSTYGPAESLLSQGNRGS